MNTHFVVPTFQRYSLVRDKTLPHMNALGVDNDNIVLFVADVEEEARYRETVPSEIKIVVGVPGIGKQRVFINNFFPAGDRVVSMDDDVSLVQKDNGRIAPLSISLPELAEKAFALCDENNVRFWGVSTSNNGFFLKHETVLGLRNCLGSLFGEYAGETECQSSLDCCEDTEKCLLHYTVHGGLIRLGDVSAVNKYYSEGGVNGFFNGKDNRINDYVNKLGVLISKYPELVYLNQKNIDSPEKGLTKVRTKTSARFPSLLPNKG